MWTHLNRQASPLLRYRSSDLATVYTAPCACGRTSPRIRIGGRRDDMLRVQAVNVYPQAIGEVLDRLGGSAGYAVVADGDPIACAAARLRREPRGPGPARDRAARRAAHRRGARPRSPPATCPSPSRRPRASSAPPAGTRCPTPSDDTGRNRTHDRDHRGARQRARDPLGQPAPPQRLGRRDDRRDRRRARAAAAATPPSAASSRAAPARTSPPATTCSRPPRPTPRASPPRSTSSSASRASSSTPPCR